MGWFSCISKHIRNDKLHHEHQLQMSSIVLIYIILRINELSNSPEGEMDDVNLGFPSIIQVLDYSLENDVDEGLDNRVNEGTFCA